MIFIILSILSLAGIFVIFKIAEKQNTSIINIIVINYFAASIIGFLQSKSNPLDIIGKEWLFMAVLIGLFFFVFFVIIGWSTKLVGLSITTVAAKMSVVIPIIFSIIYYNEDVSILKITGILAAVSGVILTVYKPSNNEVKKTGLSEILVPVILFIGMGISDSMVKYSQNAYLQNESPALFNASLFLISFVSSVLYGLFTKEIFGIFKAKTILLGLLLGFLNFYGIYFFIKALGSEIFDSSIIFGINNVGIVSLSVLTGLFLFKEKLYKINKLGILVSIIAIFILSQA